MAFKKVKRYDADAAEAANEAKASDLGGEKKGHRVRVTNGHNVYWMLPSLNEDDPKPVRFLQVHYNPFHVCNRGDSVHEGGGKFKHDNNFKNCPRCINAWNHYDAAGKPKDPKSPYKQIFTKNMSDKRAAIQLVEMTPFFDFKNGTYAQPKKDLVEKWLDHFFEVMAGATPNADMPQELVDSAQAGPQIVLVNQKLGSQIEQKHREKFFETDEDPSFVPSDMLLQIVRTKDSSTSWTNSKGETQYGSNYAVAFTPLSKKSLAYWEISDDHFSAVEERMVDIYSPAVEITEDMDEKTARSTKAMGMVRMSDSELEKYLADCEMSYKPKAAPAPAVSEADEFEDQVDNNNDPDAFEDASIIDTDDMQELEALRSTLA